MAFPRILTWRLLSSAAVAYGLTTGAYNAKEIGLTPLGSRIVAPIKEAAIVPTLFKELVEKYDQSKLPREDIAHNVVTSMGIPADRVAGSWDIFRANAKFSGLLQVIK